MLKKYKTVESGLYFVSFSVVGWIDLFVQREYQDILVENIKFCQDFKSYTTKELIKAIQKNPVESRKEWMISQFQQYGI